MRSVGNAILIGFAIFLGIGQAHAGEFDSILRWRNIGPYRGGRTRAIAGVPSQPNVFYMASGEWRRFQIDRLRSDVARRFSMISRRLGRRDCGRDFKSEHRLRRQR